MAGKMNKKLVLENGAEYFGYGFGAAEGTSGVCEIVFNTSMAGYQEIVSDPTYTGAAVVMTYPLIGNYGITDEDYEAKNPTVGALIVREYNDFPSNFRYTKTLSEYLEENGIPGIYGMDTRALTRAVRDLGTCKCVIVDADINTEVALEIITPSWLKAIPFLLEIITFGLLSMEKTALMNSMKTTTDRANL